MIYKFNLKHTNNSNSKLSHYDIYYDGKVYIENITFPTSISFYEYKAQYEIEVVNRACGSKMKYSLNNTITSTTLNPTIPSTTTVYLPPTTTSTSSTTSTSTTTVLIKTIKIDSIDIIDCNENDEGVIVKFKINVSGNYSGKFKLKIVNMNDPSKPTIVRDFGSEIFSSKYVEYALLSGKYTFTVMDNSNQSVTYTSVQYLINCPSPSFKVEYIPNSCKDETKPTKLRIYDMKNVSKFRYCFNTEQEFICSDDLDNPDATVKNGETELTIVTNSGMLATYVNGIYVIVRGYNEQNIYTDVIVEAIPCVDAGNKNLLTLTSSHTIKVDGKSNIVIYLIADGKKVNAPFDITVRGNYYVANSSASTIRDFYTIIESGSNLSRITYNMAIDEEIIDTCITSYNPMESETYTITNSSEC